MIIIKVPTAISKTGLGDESSSILLPTLENANLCFDQLVTDMRQAFVRHPHRAAASANPTFRQDMAARRGPEHDADHPHVQVARDDQLANPEDAPMPTAA
jgi:hypothetical protein